MASGPISPGAFSGKPILFSAFSEATEFLSANGIAP